MSVATLETPQKNISVFNKVTNQSRKISELPVSIAVWAQMRGPEGRADVEKANRIKRLGQIALGAISIRYMNGTPLPGQKL